MYFPKFWYSREPIGVKKKDLTVSPKILVRLRTNSVKKNTLCRNSRPFFQNFFLRSQNFGKVRPFLGEKELHSWCEKKIQKNFKKIFFFNFLVLKNECVWTWAAHPHPRGMHARTQTHIFEKFSIFTCVRASARTHTKGLEMTCVLFSSQIAHQNLFVAKHATLTEKYGSRGEEK